VDVSRLALALDPSFKGMRVEFGHQKIGGRGRAAARRSGRCRLD
jgi:hypothetical protein